MLKLNRLQLETRTYEEGTSNRNEAGLGNPYCFITTAHAPEY